MRSLLTTEQYKRDVRRLHKKHYDFSKLARTVETLRQNGAVPISQSPHKLHGQWSNHSECHIDGDWLLIYKVDASFVYLYRTGTHDELF
ncbi:MAG: type II toxin-antitoxin system YafQ family toxin [bacterium]|nr:type II toxin-antitoxin system YafQ family toxin [bacterium]